MAMIACCPEHGLHGERDECFICGGPVEKVPMVVQTVVDRERENAESWRRIAGELEDMRDAARSEVARLRGVLSQVAHDIGEEGYSSWSRRVYEQIQAAA